jgi:hypothetical protein
MRPFSHSISLLHVLLTADDKSLSKVIARRWKLLPEAGRHFYRRVARTDSSKYEAYTGKLNKKALV